MQLVHLALHRQHVSPRLASALQMLTAVATRNRATSKGRGLAHQEDVISQEGAEPVPLKVVYAWLEAVPNKAVRPVPVVA